MILAILQLPLSSFFNDSFVAKEEKKIPLALPSKHRAFSPSLILSHVSLTLKLARPTVEMESWLGPLIRSHSKKGWGSQGKPEETLKKLLTEPTVHFDT